MVDASSAIGSAGATQFLAATVGASSACLQSLLAYCVATSGVHDDEAVVVRDLKRVQKDMGLLWWQGRG